MNDIAAYQKHKSELIDIGNAFLSLFDQARKIPGMADDAFAAWSETCENLNRQLAEEILRIAVVGPIKSGKSTFANSLLGDDYLKRGAGVVTSFVTRVRKGAELNAKLIFKSWDEINSDIAQALLFFPDETLRSMAGSFDLRRKDDREALGTAMQKLNTEHWIADGARNANSALLQCYSDGYGLLEGIIGPEPVTKTYHGEAFHRHREFVADDARSVYLQDILLEIETDNISENVEVADCQGSDSPNPLHLAMIQDYLLTTHLCIYVISSRTGVRQADIKFLSIIKKMGIADNLVFVVNCDFSEHDVIGDLEKLIDKIKAELSLLISDPDPYTFSSLYNLFKTQGEQISQKDALRMEQWQSETELVALSDAETERFRKKFNHKLTHERSILFLANHLERLSIVANGVSTWLETGRGLLSDDVVSARQTVEQIRQRQGKIDQMKSLLNNTLDGAKQKIERDLFYAVDRFFDTRSDNVVGSILEFVRSYTVQLKDYEDHLDATGFASALYILFQDFKQALDSYITESVNPEILHFVMEKEAWLGSEMDNVAVTFNGIIKETVAEFSDLRNGQEPQGSIRSGQTEKRLNIKRLKELSGLKLEPVAHTMHYSAKIKTDAVMRFGFYSAVNFFRKLFKKPVEGDKNQQTLALADSLRRIKKETDKSIVSHFKDYRENLKYQYFRKILNISSQHLYQGLIERFEAGSSDLYSIADLLNDMQSKRKEAVEALASLEQSFGVISGRVTALQKQIHSP